MAKFVEEALDGIYTDKDIRSTLDCLDVHDLGIRGLDFRMPLFFRDIKTVGDLVIYMREKGSLCEIYPDETLRRKVYTSLGIESKFK